MSAKLLMPLNHNSRPGDKIRLFACDVGSTGGPAQQFANEIKHTVWAPTTKAYAAPTKWATQYEKPRRSY